MSYDGEPLVCRPLASPEPMQVVVLAHLGEETLLKPARQIIKLVRDAAGRW